MQLILLAIVLVIPIQKPQLGQPCRDVPPGGYSIRFDPGNGHSIDVWPNGGWYPVGCTPKLESIEEMKREDRRFRNRNQPLARAALQPQPTKDQSNV